MNFARISSVIPVFDSNVPRETPIRRRRTPENILTPYNGQKIYNFDFRLAAPTQDETLKRLLIAFNTPATKEDVTLIDRINARLNEISGFPLLWV